MPDPMIPSTCGLSAKQLFSINHSNTKINIWEGSVRSGKTYISLWRFIKELIEGKAPGEYLMLTKTYDTFERNILPVLTQMIGSDPKYYSGKRKMYLWGKTVNVIGCDDDSSERKIRGLTAAGSYVDEITIIPENVFKMLISRCAMGGARIFGTTNPDSPYHWLKRDYLTDNPDVTSFQFTLDDNPALKRDEKDFLHRQYKGLWYQRFIQGLWVQAEGSIYDMFSVDTHVIDWPPAQAEFYIMGVDYGTSNACSYTLIGINKTKYPNMWVEAEYYWDSRAMQRQKTDSEYAEDLIKLIAGKPVKCIYIDPSAASFKAELQKQGVSNLYDANNEVNDGIRMVAKFLDNGTLKICRNCSNLIDEIQGYVWDAKASKLGKDKPLKQRDHACVVGSTEVLTDSGYQRIDELSSGYLINFNTETNEFERDAYSNASVTREGSEVYELELDDGTILCATRDHLILTGKGYIMLQDLTPSDTVIMWNINIFKSISSIKTKQQAIGSLPSALKSECM